jgi:hypothetical protein
MDSEIGWVWIGVTLPPSISTSIRLMSSLAPPSFQVNTPPPKNHRFSPSPAFRITGASVVFSVM